MGNIVLYQRGTSGASTAHHSLCALGTGLLLSVDKLLAENVVLLVKGKPSALCAENETEAAYGYAVLCEVMDPDRVFMDW